MKSLEGEIIEYIECYHSFGKIIGEPIFPKQGMSSTVFFLQFADNFELVVKFGESVDKDLFFLNILNENNSHVPVPKVYGSFSIQDKHVLLLEKINGKLFGEIEKNEMEKYFPTVKETLAELHKIIKKTTGEEWKKYLENIFNKSFLDWSEILDRKNLDKKLVEKFTKIILEKLNKTDFSHLNLLGSSLLHTDFNQSNLFVDEKQKKIVAVIDWEEAVFGDTVYDFARFHLHLWHREISEEKIKIFLDSLNLNEKEKEREELYFLIFIVHYLAYYSEKENEFNLVRIDKHQSFLLEYKV